MNVGAADFGVVGESQSALSHLLGFKVTRWVRWGARRQAGADWRDVAVGQVSSAMRW